MTIHIPTPLRAYTEGHESVSILAGTVKDALEALVAAYPGLRGNLFGADGKLRSFVNVYLNDEDIRFLEERATPVKDGDEISIVPAIAGG